MATIFVNLASGLLSADPGSSGTTLNSAAFANLPAVAGADQLWICLDPDAVSGTPEIVKVTAHTASAPSCTVVRGQQSTTNHAHPINTVWNHVLTAADLGSLANPDWEPFTPTLNGFGATSVKANYHKSGKVITFSMTIIQTTTPSPTSVLSITGWPFAIADTGNVQPSFSVVLNVGGAFYSTSARVNGSDSVLIVNPFEIVNATANNSNLTQEVTLIGGSNADVEQIRISGVYETS